VSNRILRVLTLCVVPKPRELAGTGNERAFATEKRIRGHGLSFEFEGQVHQESVHIRNYGSASLVLRSQAGLQLLMFARKVFQDAFQGILDFRRGRENGISRD
jgi:hypothetical protein